MHNYKKHKIQKKELSVKGMVLTRDPLTYRAKYI